MDASAVFSFARSRRLLVCLAALLAVTIVSMMSACGPSEGGTDVEADGGSNGDGSNGDGSNGDGSNGDGSNGDGSNGDGSNGDGSNGGDDLEFPEGTCGGRFESCDDPDEYCFFPPDSACGTRGFGTCIPRGVDCEALPDEPVCGCNEVTYRTACDATQVGLTVAHEGPCVKRVCRAQDAQGMGVGCAELNDFGFAWNGTTCMKLRGCECKGVDCVETFVSEVECLEHYESVGCIPPPSCDADTPCPENKPFCEYPNEDVCGQSSKGQCVAKPACEPPRPCSDPEMEADDPFCLPPATSSEAVCGCDERTYESECRAWEGGVNVAYSGRCSRVECRKQQVDAWGGEGYSWDGESCGLSAWPACDDEEQRLDEEARRRCQNLPSTLTECLDKYTTLGCWEPPPCGGNSGQFCSAGFYCVYDSSDPCGVAGTPGVCEPAPTSCEGLPREPVCGCNDYMFDNACEAALRADDVKNVGLCPSICAPGEAGASGSPEDIGYAWDGTACVELAGCQGAGCYRLKQDCLDEFELRGCLEPVSCSDTKLCPPDAYCFYEADNACGSAGKPGVCKQKPTENCGVDDEPVCGCDGNDYRTQCDARKAGTATNGVPGYCIP